MDMIFYSGAHESQAVNEWLNCLKEAHSAWLPVQEISNVALPVQRLGCAGLLNDNPPIDRVDDLLSQLEQSSMRLGLISVPVSVTVPEQKLGEEISCLNGWIDTAGYAGCGHLCFCAPENETVGDSMRGLFREVCVYALDLYIQISFSGFSPSFVNSVRANLNQPQQSLIGLEQKIDGLDSIMIPKTVEDIPVSLVSVYWKNDHSSDAFQSKFQSVTQPILLHI